MKNKKGISAIVGYVLLITFGIILSVIVFNYLRTYVPTDSLDCPDGVSLFIKNYTYDCSSGELILNIKNNGKFNVEGYYAHGVNNPSVELATVDLSRNFDMDLSEDGINFTGIVYFKKQAGSNLKNNEEIEHGFVLDEMIYSLQIIPVRFQLDGNVQRVVSCGNARLVQELVCT
ncbi:MAG: hypothetical protein NUV46_02220 [Nanoarchaeota archaeon]|nr:hypothetical protein [Nanoarchaeota archaeon]